MGSEINYEELSQLVGINKVTVQKYMGILEKGYTFLNSQKGKLVKCEHLFPKRAF
ncbi:MAG: hypothetical protein GY790_00485 [Bacteroidetes bacterium]|nr:hypothetical protein [Bacteroidota bacterium]